MTNTPSLPPGGEKQADQVEAVARALYEHWKHNAMPIGRWIDADRRFKQHFEDAARAALSAARPMVGWQPIETAKKDGTHLLLASDDWGPPRIGHGYVVVEGWYCPYTGDVLSPRWWMPLLDLPKDRGEAHNSLSPHQTITPDSNQQE